LKMMFFIISVLEPSLHWADRDPVVPLSDWYSLRMNGIDILLLTFDLRITEHAGESL
jgi:hypothetical protein